MDALFRQLTLLMCDGDAIEVGLHRSLFLLRGLFPVVRLSLTVAPPDHNSVARVVAEADETAGRRADILVPMTAEAGEWASQIRSDDVVIVNRPEGHPLFAAIGEAMGVGKGSFMLAPLGIGTRPVGGLTVFAGTRDCYTEEHGNLLRSLHEPFAIALDHWVQRDRLVRLQHQLIEDRQALEHELWGSESEGIVGEHYGLRQ